MTAKPGPWVAVDMDGLVEVVNTETDTHLNVWSIRGDDEWELGQRIAARLNATEGDER